MKKAVIVALLVATTNSPAGAQVHMVLVEKPSVKVGETVTITYVLGKPFVGQRDDAEKPVQATAYGPLASSSIDLLPSLEKVKIPAGEKKFVTGYRCSFAPKERGDYTLIFESAPLWMKDQQRFFQDAIRVNLHVQAETGWAGRTQDGIPFAFLPLTRPYGLRAQTAFQAKLDNAKPERWHYVNLEKYNAEPPKELPDVEFITMRVRSDDHGVVTCTLPETGWWVLSAQQSDLPMTLPPKLKKGDKEYPLTRRAILLVFVEGGPRKKGDK